MRIPLCLLALGLASAIAETPVVVEDARILKALRDELGKAVEQKRATPGKLLVEMARKAPATLDAPAAIPTKEARPGSPGYGDLVHSVFVIGAIYKCGKCDRWHNRGAATAWALTADGLFVTSRHVMEGVQGEAVGLASVDGKVFPVTEVAAFHPSADVAVIRADLGGATVRPLPPAAVDAPVGEPVVVVSHPEGRFFFRSAGEVARYHRRPARREKPAELWMSITADYAKGSSGAPVVDSAGRVVGIATNTQSIYYGSRDPKEDDQGPLQMVIKNTVPVSELRSMIRPATGEQG